MVESESLVCVVLFLSYI